MAHQSQTYFEPSLSQLISLVKIGDCIHKHMVKCPSSVNHTSYPGFIFLHARMKYISITLLFFCYFNFNPIIDISIQLLAGDWYSSPGVNLIKTAPFDVYWKAYIKYLKLVVHEVTCMKTKVIHLYEQQKLLNFVTPPDCDFGRSIKGTFINQSRFYNDVMNKHIKVKTW